jgi:serine/threonine protein kinase
LLVGVGRTFDRTEDLPSRTKLGRFEVIECIGRGAMGVVYAAHDPLLARDVALKVLHHQTDAQRVIGEARALARLSHPNVVAIYDVGEDGGRAFIAMEMLAGTTLAAWLKVEARSWQAIVEVFLQAGRALSAAHKAGVVHGDFKPENVIIRTDGRVAVTDFGLARMVSTPSEGGQDLMIGTPAYMAPEQLEGGQATPASDQFAFATSLHEALYGARPYAAPTTRELRALMRNPRVLAQPTTRDVPAWLFTFIAHAVEIDPRFRHASVDELCTRISRKLAGDVHYTINAFLQVGMFVVHAAISTLFTWALLSPDAPAAPPKPSLPPNEVRLHYISTVIAVWLAALFFFGWGPLGVVWTPINAYGLFRRKRWALTSTLVYAACSALTCIGTPVAVYAFVTLQPLRRKSA